MELLANTLFINLKQRTDRLNHANAEFEKLGIYAERVDAIKNENGAIGCTLSHIKCLELAKQREYEYVFICEDDIEFTNLDLFNENLTKFNSNSKLNWDMLIVGGNNAPPYQQVEDYCARVFYCRTTTGYVVKKHMYDVLIDNFKEGVKLLTADQTPEGKKKYAIDMYWQRLQYQYYWYMITPPTVTQYANYSDIENKDLNYTPLLLDMDKKWYTPQI